MADNDKKHHGPSGLAIFIIIIIIIILLAAAAVFLYIRTRSRRSRSDNYPAPAPGGIVGWFTGALSKLKRGRTRQTGAGYEAAGASGGYGSSGARRGVLDPDEAWDSNVANEAYYEEQELACMLRLDTRALVMEAMAGQLPASNRLRRPTRPLV